MHGAAGQSAVHAVPFHAHVSYCSLPESPPPNRTLTPVTASKDIAAPGRADGVVVLQGAALHCCVQVVPFHSQVSPRSVGDVPPKRTETARVLSKAIAAW